MRKIRKFIAEHSSHLIIEKIRSAKPLTDQDIDTLQTFLLDSDPAISPDEFHEIIGEELELIKFVRTVSGLKRERVIQEFEDILQDNRLSSNQIQFIEQMIEFYTQKGYLEIANLYEPPFDFIDEDEIEGAFDGQENIIGSMLISVGTIKQPIISVKFNNLYCP